MGRRRANRRRRSGRSNPQKLVHMYQGLFAPGSGMIKLTASSFSFLSNRPCLVKHVSLSIALNPGPEVKVVAGAENFSIALYGPNGEQTISRSAVLVSAFQSRRINIHQRRGTDFGLLQPTDNVVSIYQHGADAAFGVVLFARATVLYSDPVDKLPTYIPEKECLWQPERPECSSPFGTEFL